MNSRKNSKHAWSQYRFDMTNRISILKFTFKLASLLICLFCFTYQTSQLLTLYLSGKTVADSRVERLANSPLPAVTICLPTFMDMEKFAELWLKFSTNQEHQKLYEDHQANKKLVAEQGWIQEAQDQQRALFENFLWNTYVVSNITIFDTMIKYLAEMEVEYRVYFGASKFNKAFNAEDIVVELPLPRQVISLVPFVDPRECVTIFSEFDENFKNYKMTPIEIELTFRHNLSSFPFIR